MIQNQDTSPGLAVNAPKLHPYQMYITPPTPTKKIINIPLHTMSNRYGYGQSSLAIAHFFELRQISTRCLQRRLDTRPPSKTLWAGYVLGEGSPESGCVHHKSYHCCSDQCVCFEHSRDISGASIFLASYSGIWHRWVYYAISWVWQPGLYSFVHRGMSTDTTINEKNIAEFPQPESYLTYANLDFSSCSIS